MNLERMRHAILGMLLADKNKGREGMLTADTIKMQLGESIGDSDVQYCLRRLGADGFVQVLQGDGRIQAVALTTRGEAVARGD